jgi:hypothetical protein
MHFPPYYIINHYLYPVRRPATRCDARSKTLAGPHRWKIGTRSNATHRTNCAKTDAATHQTMSNDTNIDPTTTRPNRDETATRHRDSDSTDTAYTDTDCTGAPVVPDLRGDADQRESIAETVWSHRTTEPNDE